MCSVTYVCAKFVVNAAYSKYELYASLPRYLLPARRFELHSLLLMLRSDVLCRMLESPMRDQLPQPTRLERNGRPEKSVQGIP